MRTVSSRVRQYDAQAWQVVEVEEVEYRPVGTSGPFIQSRFDVESLSLERGFDLGSRVGGGVIWGTTGTEHCHRNRDG